MHLRIYLVFILMYLDLYIAMYVEMFICINHTCLDIYCFLGTWIYQEICYFNWYVVEHSLNLVLFIPESNILMCLKSLKVSSCKNNWNFKQQCFCPFALHHLSGIFFLGLLASLKVPFPVGLISVLHIESISKWLLTLFKVMKIRLNFCGSFCNNFICTLLQHVFSF